MSEGAGGGKGKLFTSPQLSTVFLIEDGGLNNRWEYPLVPPEIRLHCKPQIINHKDHKGTRRKMTWITNNEIQTFRFNFSNRSTVIGLLLILIQPSLFTVYFTSIDFIFLSSPDGLVQTRTPTLTMVKAKPALIDQTWCF